jgi:hypothetical protein
MDHHYTIFRLICTLGIIFSLIVDLSMDVPLLLADTTSDGLVVRAANILVLSDAGQFSRKVVI